LSDGKRGLAYDDVLLYPQQGVVGSRSEVDVRAELPGWPLPLRLPIWSAPMETVTDFHMARAMSQQGCIGVINRFQPDTQTTSDARDLKRELPLNPVAVAIGAFVPQWLRHCQEIDILVLDVAHADTKDMLLNIEIIRREFPDKILVAGSVATYNGARRLINAGADILRVGIGAGAACTTRTVTGFGVPMVTSIEECSSVAQSHGKKIIADGGINTTGDIVKALAVGADYVMMGRMFAGVDESPKGNEYFGQASHKSAAHTGRHIEGHAGEVSPTGPLQDVLDDIEDAIRSGVSYGGGHNIEEMRQRASTLLVSPLAMKENGTRI
jgi:IMP dehydrogenase